MAIAHEELQREEFRNILFDLAELQLSLKDATSRSLIYQRLEKLYHASNESEKYRHFYSDIFIVLTTIQRGDRPGDINILGQNLAEIRKGYQPLNTDKNGEKIDIRDSLKKLYDHVSLDIARITYSDSADRKVEQKDNIAQIKREIANVQDNIDKAKEDLDSQVDTVRKAVKDAQKEYITILGIFASILLAFIGGMTFSTSVLQHMNDVGIYRLLLVIVLLGFVLINTINILLRYIFRLNDNSKIKIPIWPINIILGILALIIVAAWLFNAHDLPNYISQCFAQNE